MTQPQAATPAPEKPAVRGTGLRMPGSDFLGRAREGGIIYPFLILFVILAVWKGETFYGQTNLLEILDQQSATLIIAAAGTMVLIGAANGVITTFFRINSLIATLATSFVITGGAAL